MTMTINESVKNCILLSAYHNEQVSKQDLQELIFAQSCEDELKYLIEQGLIYQPDPQDTIYKITQGGEHYAIKLDQDYHSDYTRIKNHDVMLYTAYSNLYTLIKTRENASEMRLKLAQAQRDLDRAKRDLVTERERTTELSLFLAEERAKHAKTYEERTEAREKLKDLREAVENIAGMMRVNAESAHTNAEKIGVMKFIASALMTICGRLGYTGGIPF